MDKRETSRNRISGIAAVLFLTCCGQHLSAQSEVLTLDDAVRLALNHNLAIQKSVVSASAFDHAIAAAKTQRLPQFTFSSTTGMLLTKPTISFERGTFGEYPGIGPIPDTRTEITSPRRPTMVLSAEAALPLTQRIRIGLNIRQMEVRKKLALEDVRLARQDVVKQVRQTYYAILQSQSSLDAVEQTLTLLRDLSRQTGQYVRTGSALEGDLLSVDARLAQAEYDKIALLGPLATQKEELNHLLGRPIETTFRVTPVVEANWIPELSQARERAVVLRPELAQARLKVQQANLDRRKKKTESIPDVSLTATYYSAINVSSTLPRNVAIAGVHTSWEPFDWGRKRNELAQLTKTEEEAQLAVRDIENRIRIEVGSAHRKLQEARLLLSASRASQQSAREAARLASVRYQNGAALLTNVLESQASVADANDRVQKALAAYWSARAEIEKAMGEEQ